jgi:hypothetical protein
MLRNGRNPLQQIARGLALSRKYEHYDLDEDEATASASVDKEAQKFVKQGSTFASPAVEFVSLTSNSVLTKATCTGLSITNRFPNNIVRVTDRTGENILVVEDIREVNKDVFIFGRTFATFVPLFVIPYDSREIGVYRCSHIVNQTPCLTAPSVWKFSRITGKFFPFPTKVCRSDFGPHINHFDERIIFNPLNVNQEWITVLLRHSEMCS